MFRTYVILKKAESFSGVHRHATFERKCSIDVRAETVEFQTHQPNTVPKADQIS